MKTTKAKQGSAFLKLAESRGAADAGPPNLKQIAGKRGGHGEEVSVRIRFRREQWEALHALCKEQNASIQGLVVYGLELAFHERGRSFVTLGEKPSTSDDFGAMD